MRIVIDARLYGSRHGGLGRYIQQLVLQLPLLDPSITWLLLMGDQARADYIADIGTIPSNATIVHAPWRWYTLAEQIYLPRLIRQLKPDLTHYPHFNVPLFASRPFVVTIHDLIIHHFPSSRATTLPSLVYGVKLLAYRLIMRQAVRRSRRVIVPTKFVAADIYQQYPRINKNKIAVTYEGSADGLYHRDEGNGGGGTQSIASLPSGIHQPYLLYVGSAYPHKDVMTALRAFAELRRQGVVQTFVHVWRPDEFLTRLQKQARQEGLVDGVVWTGYAPDKQLVALYQNASAYVFSSLYEGFGLPPLEAQGYGCPVIAARASCLPEVLGDSAAWFEPGNVKQLIQVVQAVIQDPNLRQNLIHQGNQNWPRFNWDNTVRETMAQYTS